MHVPRSQPPFKSMLSLHAGASPSATEAGVHRAPGDAHRLRAGAGTLDAAGTVLPRFLRNFLDDPGQARRGVCVGAVVRVRVRVCVSRVHVCVHVCTCMCVSVCVCGE